MEPENRPFVLSLAKKLREKYPEKTIWLYTGSSWEEIAQSSVVKLVDVLVDGEFIEEQFDPKLLWKGSRNQRVIDVKKTLSGEDIYKPVIYCADYYD